MDRDALWRGLKSAARQKLISRDYSSGEIEQRLAGDGLEAGTAMLSQRVLAEAGAWIPGVELFNRHVYPQQHRGFFAELGRAGEGRLGEIGLWPKQWSAARMFIGATKGFHIHPPHVPDGETAEAWFQRLYINEPTNYSLRPYDLEQWDVMFFLSGRVDLILCDERAGLPRRTMRFFIDGDDHRGPNNAVLIIPPGVAHGLRVEGGSDLVMVYGTTTTFAPANEGRIANEVEQAPFPPEWSTYLASDSR